MYIDLLNNQNNQRTAWWVLLIGSFLLLVNLKSNSALASTEQTSKSNAGVYLINLERSKDRYQFIKNYLDQLDLKFQRIDGIDGANLSAEAIKQTVDLRSYKLLMKSPPNLGTIGCYLSHLKAWQTFLNSQFEFAIIFEDDISFEPKALNYIIKELLSKSNLHLWDLVNLEIAHHGLPLTIKKFPNQQRLVIYLTEITHAGAYIINRNAAKLLLAKALPIKMPIDHYFTRAWEFNIKFTGIEDPRMVQQTFGDSVINSTKRVSNHNNLTYLEFIKHCAYKINSYITRFLYNLKLYWYVKNVK